MFFPGNQAGTPNEVLAETSIDGRVADTQHAIKSHAMEPAHYITEARAGGAGTGMPSRTESRDATQSKSASRDAGRGPADSFEAGGLSIR